MLDAAWQATRDEMVVELRSQLQSEKSDRTWRERWQAWWIDGRLLYSKHSNRVATILGGVLLMLLTVIAPIYILASLRENLGRPSYTAWLLLASTFSLFWSTMLLADKLPEKGGWRVLLYPVRDRVLADFLQWRVPITFLMHFALASIIVVMFGTDLGWSWQLGLPLALLQAFYLTSLQLICLRWSLPDYYLGSRATIGSLFAVIIFGLAAFFVIATDPHWIPTAMPYIPLTWCVWIWQQVESGQPWAWLLLVPIAVVIGYGFYARYSLPNLTTANVLDGLRQQALGRENGVRQLHWFREPWWATRSMDRPTDDLIAARIDQLTGASRLPIWERLAYRANDQWVVPQALKASWSSGWLWTLAMLLIMVPAAWLPSREPYGPLWFVTLVLMIGLMERGLWIQEPEPWHFPVDFFRFSRVTFRRQCLRILVYGVWFVALMTLSGCLMRFPLWDTLAAVALAVTTSMALVPTVLGISFLRCTAGKQRLELVVPFAVILVFGPAAMFFLVVINEYRLHWGLLAIPISQAALSLGFWALAWQMFRWTRNPGTIQRESFKSI